jgi:hypothetical protein
MKADSQRGKNFFFSTASRLALGPIQPPIQRVPEALCPGVKRPGRKGYHSPPFSAEVPHISSWHNALLINERDKLILYLSKPNLSYVI